MADSGAGAGPGGGEELARDALTARSREALRRACRVPAPDPLADLSVLDVLVNRVRGRDPGLRAGVLRDALYARLSVAAAVPADPAAGGDATADPRADALLDELLALVAEQGLSLFGVDAQVLVAHRALLRGDDESALAAVSTALSHLDEHLVAEHAHTAAAHSEAEHRRNLHGSYLLVARSLASLGMHENGAVLLERARLFASECGDEEGVAAARYESVRLGLSWGLRLERAGRDAGPRLYGAAVTARALLSVGPRLPADHQPLLQAATVLGRRARRGDEGPDGRDAVAVDRIVGAGHAFPSLADQLVTQLAHARALERTGRLTEAADLLAAASARRPRGEPNLVLSMTRELGRLRALLAAGCDPANQAAKNALRVYIAELEGELWSMHQARELSLRARLAHDRLRREHNQVAAQAYADPLTGLPNRRALDDALTEALARVDTSPLAVAMVDVDGFKQVNDVMSHAHGDEVLRLVAGALRRTLRAGDLVARYGGDEFVVVLPGTSAADAAAALGRAGRAVADLSGASGELADDGPVTFAGPGVTLSVGVVAVEPGQDAATVLGRADAAMYHVKHAGGGAVGVDGATGAPGPPPVLPGHDRRAIRPGPREVPDRRRAGPDDGDGGRGAPRRS